MRSVGGKRRQQAGQAPVPAGMAGRRSRPAAPVVAAWSLGVLIIVLLASAVVGTLILARG